jgi:hypothetical protein
MVRWRSGPSNQTSERVVPAFFADARHQQVVRADRPLAVDAASSARSRIVSALTASGVLIDGTRPRAIATPTTTAALARPAHRHSGARSRLCSLGCKATRSAPARGQLCQVLPEPRAGGALAIVLRYAA